MAARSPVWPSETQSLKMQPAIVSSARAAAQVRDAHCFDGLAKLTALRIEKPPCKDADVIIIGAGVAGASLAITLARQGNRVHLIER